MDLVILNALRFLVVTILVAIVARRFHLPYTVGLVIAGIALAVSHLGVGLTLSHDVIFQLILPPLLFEGALNINCRDIVADAWPISVLSVIGVIISASVVSLALWILGWPIEAAVTFAALIAATDPVSVISLFKDLGVGGRLRLLVESESLFNDGVAAVLFTLVLAWSAGRAPSVSDIAINLVTLVGGGVALGFLIGAAALVVAGRSSDPLVETVVTLVAAYGAFLAAESLHFSGVLATVAAGLFMGTIGFSEKGSLGLSARGRSFALEFWDFMAFIANSAVFLLIGLAVSRFTIAAVGYGTIAIIIGIVLLSRAATVYPIGFLFKGTRDQIPLPYQHLLWWSGLRGALALALALSLPPSTAFRDVIEIATFAVVIFSVLVQGRLTMPLVLRRIGYREVGRG